MNLQSEHISNLMESDQIIQMFDNLQSTLGEDQRNCYKMDHDTSPSNSADQTNSTGAATQVGDHAAAQGTHIHWIPNQFQTMNSHQYRENDYSMKNDIASGSGINVCPNQGRDDLKTKSGYSTEEDGTISMNTAASSKASWYPYSRYNTVKRPASDSDNNSMIVEFSDDEMNVPSNFSEKKTENISDKSHGKDRADLASTWNRRRSSHFHRSIPKCARFNGITSSSNSADRSLTHSRKRRKKKSHQQEQQQDQSSDEPSCSNISQNRHSSKSTSTFIPNHLQTPIEAPHVPNNFNNFTAGSGYHDPHSALSYQAVDLNRHNFATYLQPTQLPIYNNIPILPTARPPMWSVGPIYIPTNPHVFLAFGQPHQPQIHHIHQYTQPPELPTATPQMANIPSTMPGSIARENLVGQSTATSAIPTSSTQSTGTTIRPQLNWLRKELLCPPIQTGPDGQPIKAKAKRRPLPDWMAEAVENCTGTFANHEDAHMSSTEQLYRMVVEEELDFHRSQQ